MNNPDIRFKGYAGSWEQSKLKDVADKVTEKNTALLVQETFTNSAEFGVISQRDFFERDISNADNIGGYYVIHKEDFVYNPRISTSAPVGPVNRNKLGRSGIMSPLYTIFRTHDVDTTYLEWFFKSRNWHPFMYLNGDSGARSDRFSIKDTVFFGMPIPLPCQDEQKRIGAWMNGVDNLITLNQRKLDTLKNYKKAMLVKMFPREGQKVPEIRFKGFSGDWDRCKLGDVLRTLPFKAYLKSPEPDGKYEIIQQGNVPIIGYANGVPCKDYDNTVVLGDHTLSLYKPKSPFFVATDGVRILKGTDNMNGKYLLYLLERNKPQSEGYKRYFSILADQDVLFTTNQNEQLIIGDCFDTIDNLITLHHHKLDKLKDLKQALLNKIFVKGGN